MEEGTRERGLAGVLRVQRAPRIVGLKRLSVLLPHADWLRDLRKDIVCHPHTLDQCTVYIVFDRSYNLSNPFYFYFWIYYLE